MHVFCQLEMSILNDPLETFFFLQYSSREFHNRMSAELSAIEDKFKPT